MHDLLTPSRELGQLIVNNKLSNIEPVLPLMFNWTGKPLTLYDHKPFADLFKVNLPRETTIKAGRQTGKSLSVAMKQIVLATSLPYFNTLYVTPLYEQVRRFSSQYVRPLIDQSPLHNHWVGKYTEQSVLIRSFKNYSTMYFSFAFLDADRIRNITASMVVYDELSLWNPDFIPIINETMSHSDYGITIYAGTPLTKDNISEKKWRLSSQGEWLIICDHCGYHNIPTLDQDLDKLLGPYHPDISEARPATICAKCRLTVSPRHGYWQHRYPERVDHNPGYHIPQLLLPIHYAKPSAWAKLLGKQQGAGNFTTAKFYNEVMGESYDLATKLVTETELQQAACLPIVNHYSEPRDALKLKENYLLRILGVDWGGGGQDEVSFTTAAVLGLRPDGRLDCIYGYRSLTPHDHIGEAKQLLHIYHMFNCHIFAHDYNVLGSIRETLMVESGLSLACIFPAVYALVGKQDFIIFKQPSSSLSRGYYQIDKSRALGLVCQCIKTQWLRFFQYDYKNEDNIGLLYDFLALQEIKIDSPRGHSYRNIGRNPNFSDDFAHAVCLACAAAWHKTQRYPNLAALAGLQTTSTALPAALSL